MSTGQFIQAGPTPSGQAGDGYGEFVTVGKLDELERARIRQRLADSRPELLGEAAKVVRAKLEADADFEKLRAELHRAVGGDGVRTALGFLTESASRQIATDLATKHSANEAAAKAAAAKTK